MNLKCVLLLAMTWAIQDATAQKNSPALSPTSKLKGMDPILEKLLNEFNVAGFSVAVVYKDSTIYARGFGYRDLENKKPVTPNTLFAIGSVSKAFTAALLGKLQNEKKLGLDDKANKYLPNFRFSDKRENEVTIRDLITHRTGMPGYDHSWYLFNTDSRDSLLSRIEFMKPTASLRSKWQYNNFMYVVQGMITEAITGKTWEENIKQQFFAPLNMHRSNVDVRDMAKDDDAASGYTVDPQKRIIKLPYFEIRGMGPAGSINSSVTEMAAWVKTWINGGRFQGKEILPFSYTQEAMKSQMAMPGQLPNSKHPDVHLSNYGLGWMIGSYKGHYQVEHGGNIDGFSSSTTIYPTDSLAIIVLTNQSRSPVPSIVKNYIADRMLGLKYYDWSESEARKKSSNQPIIEPQKEDAGKISHTTPSHAPEKYTGNYHNPAFGTFSITQKNDTLFTQIGKGLSWLRHYHYDVFEIKGVHPETGADNSIGGIKLNFRTANDGSVESATVTINPAMEADEYKREPTVKDSRSVAFDKYIGNYDLSGITVTISERNGILFVFVPGQKNYETLFQGSHIFKLKDLNGFSIKFQLEGAEKANAVTFIQPNGSFKAVRIK